MQLIVLGMHRSGTSVLARLLNLMGAYFAPEGVSTGANKENPKGFWERRDVRVLNDMVLHAANCDWDRVAAFDPAEVPKATLDEFHKRAASLVLELDGHRPWFLKEPRLCLLLPLWRRWFEIPVGIHIYRHPVEVASSLSKRNGIPIPAGLALWERYARSAYEASTDIPRVVVAHRELILTPHVALARVHQSLVELGVSGLRLPSAREVEAFVRDDLYRERESRDDLLAHAKAPQIALFNALVTGQPLSEELRSAPTDYGALLRYEAQRLVATKQSSEGKVSETIESLRGLLALREQEVKFVREMSGRFEADLKRIEETRAATDNKYLEARESAIRLEADLKLCNDRVASLEGAVKQRDELIKTVEQAHQEGLEQIATLLAGRKGDAERLAGLEASAQQRDGLIKTLEEARKDGLERIASLESAHRAAAERATELEQARQQDITAAQAKLDAIGKSLSTAEAEARALSHKLRETEEALTRHAKLLSEANDERVKVERKSEVRLQEVTKLSKLLIERERDMTDALKRRDQQISTLQTDLKVRLDESKGRITELLSEVESIRKRNAIVEKELRRGRASLAELQAIKSSRSWKVVSRVIGMFSRENAETNPVALLQHDATLIRQSGLFDTQWYLQKYPDVLAANADPVEHFLNFGADELRDPSPGFDTSAYLDKYPDVRDSGTNPLLHYIKHGQAEGRRPSE